MILCGWRDGERVTLRQAGGLLLAMLGLAVMMAPGLTAPPWVGALLMLTAGVAWAAYSLLGRGSGDPVGDTAGNFLRTVPVSIVLSLAVRDRLHVDAIGALYAVLSGVVTSGCGYTSSGPARCENSTPHRYSLSCRYFRRWVASSFLVT